MQIDSESKEKAIADRLTHDLENIGLEINIVDTRK